MKLIKLNHKILSNDMVAAAQITLKLYDDTEIVFEGWAKRHPKDDADRMIGEALALSRATKQLVYFLDGWVEQAVEMNCAPPRHMLFEALMEAMDGNYRAVDGAATDTY